MSAAERDCIFFMENMFLLKRRGMYETALVDAYTSTDTIWSYRDLEFLFGYADRNKLRAAGDPIPDGKLTLYRGVSGLLGKRKVSGMSWTRSLELARWFANWRNTPNPTVYETVASTDDVYFYTNGREEQEFVLRAKKYRRLDCLAEPTPGEPTPLGAIMPVASGLQQGCPGMFAWGGLPAGCVPRTSET